MQNVTFPSSNQDITAIDLENTFYNLACASQKFEYY
jgi:hypothetical protein